MKTWFSKTRFGNMFTNNLLTRRLICPSWPSRWCCRSPPTNSPNRRLPGADCLAHCDSARRQQRGRIAFAGSGNGNSGRAGDASGRKRCRHFSLQSEMTADGQ